ncbi:MAG: NAD(P)-dependent oxidoreductase [Lentisphaeria bacterium]|jgi:glutamyl-tRNA reductase
MAELTPTGNVKKPVFPVSLLAAGKPALVVGGGRVGLRKVRLLLEAAAQVTVVSPDLHPELAALAGQGAVGHIPRKFIPADVEGRFLVFAATADRGVNREILALCRQRGVLACGIDENWPDGAFVTPATFRTDGVVVAVSTGGKSCRRARLVKDSLAKHLALVETADLLVVGTSHEHLPLEEREPFHLTGRRFEETGEMLAQLWGLHEFAILNTCNRIELHAVAGAAAGLERAILRLLGFDRLPAAGFYLKRGFDAFSHAATVAAGLLSQTPGEKHIVAQLKEAQASAARRGWAGAMLEQWLSSALHVSKEIRQETEGLFHACEIEDLCLRYLRAEPAGGNGNPRRTLVVGSGVVGRALVANLAAAGVPVDWCYHRQRPEPPPGAAAGAITLFDLRELPQRLAAAEAVVCATASPEPVLHAAHAPFFNRGRTTCILDLATPRNVAPDLAAAAPVTILDLDGLKHWHRREGVDLEHTLGRAAAIAAAHKEMYDRLIASFQGGNPGQ